MAYQQIITERRGRVGIIRLNRPERLNAFGKQMSNELFEAVEGYNQDPDIGAIVLTGEGRAFSTGFDIEAAQDTGMRRWQEEMAARAKGGEPAGSRQGNPRSLPIWLGLAQRSKPIVAAINGIAVGAGLTMTLPCDVRLASDQARFSLPFVPIGLVPEMGCTRLLVQTVGLGIAQELLLTARTIDAQEAERIGLVNRVVPHRQLMEAALAVAEEIAAHPTSALLATKQLIWANLCEADLSEVTRREQELMGLMMREPAFKEAARAFLGKRSRRNSTGGP